MHRIKKVEDGDTLQVIIDPGNDAPKPVSHDSLTASLRVSRFLGSSEHEARESILLLGAEGELNTVDDGLVKPHLQGREILFLIDYDVSSFSRYVLGLAGETTAMKIAVTVLPNKFLRKHKSHIEFVPESTIRCSDFSVHIDPDHFLDADPIAAESVASNLLRLDLWITNLISVFSRPSLRLPLLGLLHETYTSNLGVFGASASLKVISITDKADSLDALVELFQQLELDKQHFSDCDAVVLLILSAEHSDNTFDSLIREAVSIQISRPVEVFAERILEPAKTNEIKLGILPVEFKHDTKASTKEGSSIGPEQTLSKAAFSEENLPGNSPVTPPIVDKSSDSLRANEPGLNDRSTFPKKAPSKKSVWSFSWSDVPMFLILLPFAVYFWVAMGAVVVGIVVALFPFALAIMLSVFQKESNFWAATWNILFVVWVLLMFG